MGAERQDITPGCLYVVATPIGNLDDITLRALKILQHVDLVVAEDTRHTGRLLAHHGLKCPLLSCHEHNQAQRAPLILDKLAQGAKIALITDAGTPGISDPGYVLVHAARQARCAVIPIPGASAAISALSVAGLPSDRFLFIGFPATSGGRRRRQLEALATESGTLIFYESPRRILTLLKDLQAVLGDRPAFLAREMTKLHEEYLYGHLAELYHQLEKRAIVKGECTLLVGGWVDGGQTAESDDDINWELALEELQKANLAEEKLTALSARIASRHGVSRRAIYQAGVDLKKTPNV